MSRGGPPWTVDDSGFSFEEGSSSHVIQGSSCELSSGRYYCSVPEGYVIVVLSTPAQISASGINARTNQDVLDEFASRVLEAYLAGR